MKKLFCVIFVLLLGVQSFSQDTWAQEYTKGYTIYQDPIIDSLLILHKKFNAMDSRTEGYRIQIFFESGNNSKMLAQKIQESFMELFPETSAYISFKEPFYRVRVGDYKTRLEADRFLVQIKREYPNAWVIRDKINFPKIRQENIDEVLDY